MKNSELLRDAADILRSGGHCKKMLSDGKGRHCAVGALAAVYNDLSAIFFRDIEKVALEQYPERFLPNRYNSLVEFNNHPDTTGDEVIAVFEKAAVMFEEKGE
jgi:hypothetical protein